MSSKLSVEEVLSNLEARVAFHRKQEAFHAAQEVQVLKSLEAFRAVATTAVELARPVALLKAEPAPVAEPKLPPPVRLISIAVNDLRLPEPFGPKSVAAEINRRFAAHLKKPIDTRTASDVLRHLRAAGEIELARKGKAVHEALYQRKPRPAGA